MFLQKVLKRRLPSLAKIETDKFAVSGLHANLEINAKATGKSAIAIKCLDLIENPSADVAFIRSLDGERKTKMRYTSHVYFEMLHREKFYIFKTLIK